MFNPVGSGAQPNSALPTPGTNASRPGTSEGNFSDANPAAVVQQAAGQQQQPSFREAWEKIQKTMGEKPAQVRTPKKKLDKDDFLKLMVSQMKHQDPTKPFDAEKMATEMAQMASLEQLQNMNLKLDKLSNANKPLEQLQMTGLIGKYVEVDRNRFVQNRGETQTLTYSLPEKANVQVTLINPKGEAVFEKDLGEVDPGQHQFTWDGKKKGGILEAEAGTYLLQVTARTKDDRTVPISTKSRAQVIGVVYDPKEPAFLVDDANHQEKVPFSSVSQIDVNPDTTSPMLKQKAKADGQSAAQKAAEERIPEAMREAIKQAEAERQQSVQTAMAGGGPVAKKFEEAEEMGFPNGLGEAKAENVDVTKNSPGKEESNEE